MTGSLSPALPADVVGGGPPPADLGSAGAVATFALIIFLAIYSRISKPVNTALAAAALEDRVPGDARQLQARWDSVINGRAALQTFALAALCIGLAAA